MFVPSLMTTVSISRWEFAGIQAGIFFGGMLMLLGAVFLVSLLFAPYRQRNEARGELLRHEGLLWIRAKGMRCLDERLGPVRFKFAWHFRVNITNPSPDKNMGIRSIILRSKERPELFLRPTVGIVGAGIQGSKDKGLVGDIGSELFLAPSEPITGTLVFVGENKYFGDNWNNGGLFVDGIIVLIDSQGSEYSFPTDIAHITAL